MISPNQKKLGIRVLFYFLLLLLLFLIPVVYKQFFMTYGIEMLYFISPLYIIGEFIGTSILVFWVEYYWFVKKKVEIKNEELRKGISSGLVFFLICVSKLFVLWLG